MRQLILIIHNVRSAHNVGALLRTAEGLGIEQVWLTGYTPYPLMADDERLPHIANRVNRQISKTALGAEKLVAWSHSSAAQEVITDLKHQGYRVLALEQGPGSVQLSAFQPGAKTALIVGREVGGLEPEILAAVDGSLEIPMFGRKESFNVAAAAAMGLYHIRFAGS